jgi:hypothetical protein
MRERDPDRRSLALVDVVATVAVATVPTMPSVSFGRTSFVMAELVGLPSTSSIVVRVPVPPPPPDEPVFVIVTVWPATPRAMPEPAATLSVADEAVGAVRGQLVDALVDVVGARVRRRRSRRIGRADGIRVRAERRGGADRPPVDAARAVGQRAPWSSSSRASSAARPAGGRWCRGRSRASRGGRCRSG